MRNDARRSAHLLRALVLLYAVAAGFFIVLFKGSVLPDRFGLDSNLIRRLAETGLTTGDKSYDATAGVYRVLGLADNPTAVGLLGYGLAVAALFVVARQVSRPEMTAEVMAMLAVSVVLSAVYLGFYSKDFIVLGITLTVVLAPANRRGLIAVMLVIAAYAHFFRSYWYVTLAVFMVFLWLLARRTRPVRLAAAAALAVAVVSVAIFVLRDVPSDFYRDVVNATRLGDANATTLIDRFIELKEPGGGVVNNLLTAFALVVPVPLLALGGVYVVLGLVIFGIWAMFLTATARLHRAPAQAAVYRAAAMVLAFLVTQAIFEPDYGSAQRHLSPLLPLMLLVVWSVAVRQDGPPDHLRADVDGSAREVADRHHGVESRGDLHRYE